MADRCLAAAPTAVRVKVPTPVLLPISPEVGAAMAVLRATSQLRSTNSKKPSSVKRKKNSNKLAWPEPGTRRPFNKSFAPETKSAATILAPAAAVRNTRSVAAHNRGSTKSMKTHRCLAQVAVLAVCLMQAMSTLADDVVPEALRPPKGAQIALVVFEDLQCPACGGVAPLLEMASRNYKIPLVQHDFPLPMHKWSFDAAVMARYFDTHSKELGNEFRKTVFEHQKEIITPQNLRAFEKKFAAEHKVAVPFAVDPDGKLAKLVEADRSLGQSLNIYQTPTIYIVSSKKNSTPYVLVKDTNQLYVMIDSMK
jgi:protein-disulfide isomerase